MHGFQHSRLVVYCLRGAVVRRRSYDWQVLGVDLDTGSMLERDFRCSVGRCKATGPSPLSVAMNRLLAHCLCRQPVQLTRVHRTTCLKLKWILVEQ